MYVCTYIVRRNKFLAIYIQVAIMTDAHHLNSFNIHNNSHDDSVTFLYGVIVVKSDSAIICFASSNLVIT